MAKLLFKLNSVPEDEAEDKEQVSLGTVYFAPPNYHLLIEGDESFSLSTDFQIRS